MRADREDGSDSLPSTERQRKHRSDGTLDQVLEQHVNETLAEPRESKNPSTRFRSVTRIRRRLSLRSRSSCGSVSSAPDSDRRGLHWGTPRRFPASVSSQPPILVPAMLSIPTLTIGFPWDEFNPLRHPASRVTWLSVGVVHQPDRRGPSQTELSTPLATPGAVHRIHSLCKKPKVLLNRSTGHRPPHLYTRPKFTLNTRCNGSNRLLGQVQGGEHVA